jgi:hypothetical protein
MIQDIAMRTDEHHRCAQSDAHRVMRTSARMAYAWKGLHLTEGWSACWLRTRPALVEALAALSECERVRLVD